MMMPISSEFIELCEAQVEILSDALGAALCIVYLADEPMSGHKSEHHATHLVPVVVKPEGAAEWTDREQTTWLENRNRWRDDQPISQSMSLPAADQPNSPETEKNPEIVSLSRQLLDVQQLDKEEAAELETDLRALHASEAELSEQQDELLETTSITSISDDADSSEHLQIAIPLAYQGVMVGLLIAARPDRFWTSREQHQIEQIAKTLTSAYVVDQRARWLKERLANQQAAHQAIFAQQQDIFDDLLHQFRNPLTALRTFGKLLLRRLQSEDRNQDVVEGIVRESDRLQELLQRFKSALDEPLPSLMSSEPEPDFSDEFTVQHDTDTSSLRVTPYRSAEPTSETSRFLPNDTTDERASSSQYLIGHDVSREPCQWNDVLAPVLVVAEAIAQDRDIDFEVDIPTDLPAVLADPLSLRESMNNLIDNALKYTPPGGQVRVQGGIQSEGLQAIAVIDSGPGIPEADLEHLFERHYRGVQAQGPISGTGLGLAIAKDLLRQMAGDIEVFSPVSEAEFLSQWSPAETTGPGTAFVVWLEQDEASCSSSA